MLDQHTYLPVAPVPLEAFMQYKRDDLVLMPGAISRGRAALLPDIRCISSRVKLACWLHNAILLREVGAPGCLQCLHGTYVASILQGQPALWS